MLNKVISSIGNIDLPFTLKILIITKCLTNYIFSKGCFRIHVLFSSIHILHNRSLFIETVRSSFCTSCFFLSIHILHNRSLFIETFERVLFFSSIYKYCTIVLFLLEFSEEFFYYSQVFLYLTLGIFHLLTLYMDEVSKKDSLFYRTINSSQLSFGQIKKVVAQ